MSPAPVRQRTTTERFPHSWGYGLGLVLVIAGIAVAAWGVISGVTGFADDVNDLRRVIDGSALEASLESGEEVVVYDEADINAGPFDVTVVRTSDGAVVPTTSIVDGVDYDVDGNSGRARVGFRVPTSDIYRVEVDTSVGQIARFAVGGDIGNNRTSRIIQGVTIGAILAIAGLVAMVWTLILHARWRVRHAVLDRVQRTRSVVAETTDAVSSSAQEQRAGEATDRAAGWARERLDEARARLESEGDHGRSPEWRQRLADEARRRLDQADGALSSLEPAVTEQVSGSDLPADIAGQVGDALGRIEERLQAGESLRDIARGERVAAEDAARELADRAEVARAQAEAARSEVEDQLADVRGRSTQHAREQVRGLTTDLEDVASAAFESALAQTGDAGDDLATGLAATAATAGAAAGVAVTARGRDALGLEVEQPETDPASLPAPPSSLPAPPSSSLPAPPSASLPAPPPAAFPVPPPMPDTPRELVGGGTEPDASEPSESERKPEQSGDESAADVAEPVQSQPAPATTAAPATTGPAALVPAAPSAAALLPERADSRTSSRPMVSRASESVATVVAAPAIAPPPQVRLLPPGGRTRVQPSARAEPEPQAEAGAEGADRPPAGRVDTFSALAPPPAAGPRLTSRPLDRTAAASTPVADESIPAGAADDVDGAPPTAPPSTRSGFTLAPPPDYAALGANRGE